MNNQTRRYIKRIKELNGKEHLLVSKVITGR